MKHLDDRERELLEKLKKACKKQNYFTLTLKINDILLEEKIFPAEKYSIETLSETRTHYLFNDLVREILKRFSETENVNQENLKKEQIDKLWREQEEKNKKNNL